MKEIWLVSGGPIHRDKALREGTFWTQRKDLQSGLFGLDYHCLFSVKTHQNPLFGFLKNKLVKEGSENWTAFNDREVQWNSEMQS